MFFFVVVCVVVFGAICWALSCAIVDAASGRPLPSDDIPLHAAEVRQVNRRRSGLRRAYWIALTMLVLLGFPLYLPFSGLIIPVMWLAWFALIAAILVAPLILLQWPAFHFLARLFGMDASSADASGDCESDSDKMAAIS